MCFDWLKSQKLDNVRRLLKDQSLRKFLELKGNINPDLVRVFYTNLKFEGNNLVSLVKGVEMEITHEVWAAEAGLKFSGLRINKGNLGVVEDFNKIQFYKSCLKNKQSQVSTYSVGGLKIDERLLALIVTWILILPVDQNVGTCLVKLGSTCAPLQPPSFVAIDLKNLQKNRAAPLRPIALQRPSQ